MFVVHATTRTGARVWDTRIEVSPGAVAYMGEFVIAVHTCVRVDGAR